MYTTARGPLKRQGTYLHMISTRLSSKSFCVWSVTSTTSCSTAEIVVVPYLLSESATIVGTCSNHASLVLFSNVQALNLTSAAHGVPLIQSPHESSSMIRHVQRLLAFRASIEHAAKPRPRHVFGIEPGSMLEWVISRKRDSSRWGKGQALLSFA